MKILGIETSCDETAVSLVEAEGHLTSARVRVLGNALLSQAKLHEEYGGVFPTLAKREHQKNLVPLLLSVLTQAQIPLSPKNQNYTIYRIVLESIEKIFDREPELREHFLRDVAHIPAPDIDAIAVTHGPGLEPALWVGINFAKALGLLWNKPVIPANHMEGHLLAGLLESDPDDASRFALRAPNTPALALLISGAHTEIVLMENIGSYKILGETKDDAAGEAFDKVARMLDLPYPGGPHISRLADEARAEDLQLQKPLPRPMIGSNNLDFSFSGLKTAVLYLLRDTPKPEQTDAFKKKIAREFEDAVCDVFEKKAEKALSDTGAGTLVLGGGVSANREIRKRLSVLCDQLGVEIRIPSPELTTDNALMIALAGFAKQTYSPIPPSDFAAEGNLRIGDSPRT